jgi:hypothetical protein
MAKIDLFRARLRAIRRESAPFRHDGVADRCPAPSRLQLA